MTPIQPIFYRGRIVAACTAERFWLNEELDLRHADHAERTFVILMCAYAGDVARGLLPGPYRDEDAARYARAALIPGELLERSLLDDARCARGLGVPVHELRAARAEHRATPRPPGFDSGSE